MKRTRRAISGRRRPSVREFDFRADNFEYKANTRYHFPRQITICAPGVLDPALKMTKILEAQDTPENFSLVLRFLAKHVLRIKLGYFRFASDFILAVIRTGESIQESGTA